MKKLVILLFLISISLTGISQGLFRPVSLFPTKTENDHRVSLGDNAITQKWEWRFDASLSIVELNYNKATKQLASTAFSAVGPAIGYQHFVPTSATDPTPFNNYGFSFAVMLGESIYTPDVARLKLALVANVLQYLKFGVTYTPKPAADIFPVGFFFGGGITF